MVLTDDVHDAGLGLGDEVRRVGGYLADVLALEARFHVVQHDVSLVALVELQQRGPRSVSR